MIARLSTHHIRRFCHRAKPPSSPQPLASLFRPESTVLGSWLKVLRTPPLSFRSQAMQPPRPEPWPPSEARDRRGQKLTEEKMRMRRINELLRLTRRELCDLAARITADLPHYPEGSVEHANAHQPAQHPPGAGAAAASAKLMAAEHTLRVAKRLVRRLVRQCALRSFSQNR